MQVVAPPSVAGQTERCRRWRHHSFPSSGAAGGHTGARKQSADRVYISSQPCRVLCPPPASTGRNLPRSSSRAPALKRGDFCLRSEQHRLRRRKVDRNGVPPSWGPLSPPRAPAVPHFSHGRDPRAPVCSCRNLQFLMHAVPVVWCALAELRSWFAVDAERPAQRSWPLATCRVARAVCDLDNAGKEDLVRTVSQLAAQELDHLAPATDHS